MSAPFDSFATSMFDKGQYVTSMGSNCLFIEDLAALNFSGYIRFLDTINTQPRGKGVGVLLDATIAQVT